MFVLVQTKRVSNIHDLNFIGIFVIKHIYQSMQRGSICLFVL